MSKIAKIAPKYRAKQFYLRYNMDTGRKTEASGHRRGIGSAFLAREEAMM